MSEPEGHEEVGELNRITSCSSFLCADYFGEAAIVSNWTGLVGWSYNSGEIGAIPFYCRTVQHTDTNKDLIYAATPPPY